MDLNCILSPVDMLAVCGVPDCTQTSGGVPPSSLGGPGRCSIGVCATVWEDRGVGADAALASAKESYNVWQGECQNQG